MAEQLGDKPIEPKMKEVMSALAHGVDLFLNGDREKSNGFVLMVFPFKNFTGRCNYISNARRADIILLMREQLARFESQPEDKPE